MKRFFSLFLAALMLLSFAACTCNQENSPTHTPELILTAEPTGTPEAKPTAEPSEEDLKFEELDKELFVSAVISDGLTYHQYVKNPASFGIDEADIERGWGVFSYSAYLESMEENNDYFERLEAIDREQLSELNQIAYDNLMSSYTRTMQMGDIYYNAEPLLPLNGDHSMLPLMLTLYEINNSEDIENYMTLLEDTDEYLGMIEQFEREKADLGMFMTENALNQVLETCEKYVKSGKKFFLVDSFESALKSENLDLSEGERQNYLERNENYIVNELLPAYQSLIDTLNSLRSKCSAFTGAVNRSGDALEWYKYNVQGNGACFYDVSRIERRLKSLCESTYNNMITIIQNNPTVYNYYFNDVTSGSAEEDVEYLESLIQNVYPKIADQEIDFVTVPDAVADDFSPAAYLISAFDDPSRNVVMFNPSADTSTLLFTLAHECFPGHLYQTQYFRQLDGLSLSQQLAAPTGYTEGWAVFSEMFITNYTSQYDEKTCEVKQLESTLFNILIPAYISLKVNIDGWTEEQVGAYLETYSINEEGFRSIVYEYAIDMPDYFFNYALGYLCTKLIYDSVNPASDADKLEFFTCYLNYGPCTFDILFEKFNLEF